jgi:alpha-beta hydrolase superfamily lysophospholipase
MLKSVSLSLHNSKMASTAKPHIVIVPGACHVAHHWRLFQASMEKAGYGVTFQPLLCNIEDGTQAPSDSMVKSVAAIRAAVVKQIENERDVVVVAHSAGGAAVGGALCGLRKDG